MIARPAALAVAVALAVPAAGAEGDVSVQATLHARFTGTRNVPGTAVLFDRASQAFELSSYLVPSGSDGHGSTFASISAQGAGLGGDLAWRLALDTGELRRSSFPAVTIGCFTNSGTGLTTDRNQCMPFLNPVPFVVEDTRLDPPLLTANGRPVASEFRSTLLVREAYATLSFGRASFATVRAGRKRVSVADGFVYDDYATGAELALDLGAIGPPISVTASLFQPTRDWPRGVAGISPFAAVRADWLPSLFEHAGIFVAVHRDRTGSVAELFRGAIVERLATRLVQASPDTTAYREANQLLARVLGDRLESDASLAWAGTSGSLAPWRGQRVGWTAALVRGRIDHVTSRSFLRPVVASDVAIRGRLLSATWDADVGNALGLGASFLYLSGGNFPPTGTYGGFLGIAPFVTATNLFFGGGLSESFAARQSTAPGVNGRGVLAPGISLGFDPTSALGIDLKAAYLAAPVKGPFGGRAYGTEVDAALSWAVREGIILGVELDALWPGDFYAGGRTVYKTILALDVVTP